MREHPQGQSVSQKQGLHHSDNALHKKGLLAGQKQAWMTVSFAGQKQAWMMVRFTHTDFTAYKQNHGLTRFFEIWREAERARKNGVCSAEHARCCSSHGLFRGNSGSTSQLDLNLQASGGA
jgi:hypothetical protein